MVGLFDRISLVQNRRDRAAHRLAVLHRHGAVGALGHDLQGQPVLVDQAGAHEAKTQRRDHGRDQCRDARIGAGFPDDSSSSRPRIWLPYSRDRAFPQESAHPIPNAGRPSFSAPLLLHGSHAAWGLTGSPKSTYLCGNAQKERIMSTPSRPSRFLGLFDLFGSAIAVAAATDSGRRPRARDLQALGIDPKQFNGINGRG